MKLDFTKKIRKEISENASGKIYNISRIPCLKEKHYCIIPFDLDGDAPKRFMKAYFYEQGGNVLISKFKTWNSYIAKSAEKWYPHESIIEYMLNRIGQNLGLHMNSIKLCQINGQIRFLSEYFLDAENEELIHGAQICGEYLEDNLLADQIADDKKSARELFTIEFIFEAINSIFNNSCKELCTELIKMLVFDAIVGNNDRHFYNWGVIKKIIKGESNPQFSPIYDTARGLLWNWSDNHVIAQLSNLNSGGKKVTNYIKNASPRISIEKNSEINHFELIEFIWNSYPNYHGTISDLLTLNKEKNVLMLYNTDFKFYFIPERNELVRYVLKERFKKLRTIIKTND